ncbi:hypothetical protein LQK89_17450 (plasmid) [Curtobacterium sp. C1]|uniref:hypothetical protein n=1 Tax=Curtobacterium sp. C1 TaxID=2898151 RepID=UPI001E551628|nr:hypothetical protein [Curtobacterium sp. C1]UFU16006.1 hypothetical protein LQK89_17450 [Curtobacterium sp. C1]
MSAVELYFAATLGAGIIWIFIPGPIGARALVLFRVLVRAERRQDDGGTEESS